MNIIILFVCISKCKIMFWLNKYCSFYAVMIWFSLSVSFMDIRGHGTVAPELGSAMQYRQRASKQMNKTFNARLGAALIGNF